MKKEKRGDWPRALDVLDESEAYFINDPIPSPTLAQEEEHREQIKKEKKHPHPSHSWKLDDKNLD